MPEIPQPDTLFSPDYSSARERFVAAARGAGARLDCLVLGARGPGGQSLSVDIAWLGARAPARAVLQSSGVHGVEGFAGSAIQLAILSDPPELDADQALILVHILNPYGMAWLRRANENNVDLNRNCLGEAGHAWRGAPATYRALETFLNPRSPPHADAFYLRALAAVLRYGFGPVRQAVAGGQYDYPCGVFYGGSRLEEGPARYRDWLRTYLCEVEELVAIDVHTGLGPWGHGSLFEEWGPASAAAEHAGYAVRGAVLTALATWLPRARLRAVTQEFGTYSTLRVLHALREENRWHFYGPVARGGAGSDDSLAHPSKVRLRAALCPDDLGWRRGVLAQGTALVAEACRWRVLAAG